MKCFQFVGCGGKNLSVKKDRELFNFKEGHNSILIEILGQAEFLLKAPNSLLTKQQNSINSLVFIEAKTIIFRRTQKDGKKPILNERGKPINFPASFRAIYSQGVQ